MKWFRVVGDAFGGAQTDHGFALGSRAALLVVEALRRARPRTARGAFIDYRAVPL